MAVLNSFLYNSLCRHFGDGDVNVRVAAEGEKLDWSVHQQPSRQRPRREVRNSGEEYVVRCPFCSQSATRRW